MQSDMCIYIYTYSSQYWNAGQAKDINKKDSSECCMTFGHVCHRFASPGLGLRINFFCVSHLLTGKFTVLHLTSIWILLFSL